MTSPRCLDPGQTYLITRRCTGRRFLLSPSAEVNALLLYCLAEASRTYGIEVHAFVFMSNHYHLVVSETSSEVRLPEFMSWLNRQTAVLINDLRERSENLWASGTYSAVVLADEAAVLDKIVYTICNPVAAGLVESPRAWPGLRSLPDTMARGGFEAERPSYFRKTRPQTARLKLTRPPCFRGVSKENFRKLVARQVRHRLAAIYDQRALDGKSGFIGPRNIANQNPEAQPTKPEPKAQQTPSLACKNRARRLKIIDGLKTFHSSHRLSLESWRQGDREVVFPAGTYKMRHLHKANSIRGPGVYALE